MQSPADQQRERRRILRSAGAGKTLAGILGSNNAAVQPTYQAAGISREGAVSGRVTYMSDKTMEEIAGGPVTMHTFSYAGPGLVGPVLGQANDANSSAVVSEEPTFTLEPTASASPQNSQRKASFSVSRSASCGEAAS